MLEQLKIGFMHDHPFDWSNGKRYDFYIENLSLIIETHGGQHYNDGFTTLGGKTAQEQQVIDEYKQNLAINNNIGTYIQLDCRMSNLEYIKHSIINSYLSEIFDLSDVDWEKCDKYAFNSSRFIETCELWNEHQDTKLISNKLHMSRTTVIDYLNRGTKLGLCNYNAKDNITKIRSKSVICVETNKIYKKMNDTKKDGFNPKCVSNCCNGYQEKHKGCHFKFYDMEVS